MRYRSSEVAAAHIVFSVATPLQADVTDPLRTAVVVFITASPTRLGLVRQALKVKAESSRTRRSA